MESKKKSISTKESWYIFVIVMLSILLALSLWLFLQNPFITNKPQKPVLPWLGTPCNILCNDVGATSQAMFFYGALLPEFNVRQDVNITLKANQSPAAVRARVYMFDDQNKQVDLFATASTQWVLGQDGYYYCSENLEANLTLDFLEYVQMPPTEKNLNAEAIYCLLIEVETLPTTVNHEEIWNIV